MVIMARLAHMLLIAEAQEDSNETPESYYFQSLELFLGGGFDVNGPSKIATVTSTIFAFVIGILLLNILIAVISSEFTKVVANGTSAFWRNRLNFLVEIHYTLSCTEEIAVRPGRWNR